jgi:hypothetical protein
MESKRGSSVPGKGAVLVRFCLALLNPRFLARLDRRLLIAFPHVWRSNIHYVAWYTLGPAAAWGFLYWPLLVVPTVAELEGWALFLLVLSLLGMARWVFILSRKPRDEQHPGAFLRTALLSAACLFCLLATPGIFVAAAASQIAAFEPDAQFYPEYEFHASHHFWRADPGLTAEVAAKEHEKIAASLARYGLSTQFSDEPVTGTGQYDYQSGPSLEFSSLATPPSPEPFLLQERLQSVYEAKRFWHGSGAFFYDFIFWLPLASLACVTGGLILGLVFRPRHVWARSLAPLASRLALPRFLRWRPAAFHRLDRHLLIAWPVVWSARLHRFWLAPGPFLLACFVAGNVVLSQHFQTPDKSDSAMTVAANLYGLYFIAGWAWLGPIRNRLRLATVGHALQILACYLAGVLAFPMLLALLSGKSETILSTAGVASAVGSYFACGLLLWSFVTFIPIAFSLAFSLAALGIMLLGPWYTVGGKDTVSVWSALVLLIVPVSFLCWSASSRWGIRASVVASSFCMLLPSIAIMIGVTFGDLKSSLTWGLLLGAGAGVVLYFLGLRALIRIRFSPQA